jgi:hypothetical protein
MALYVQTWLESDVRLVKQSRAASRWTNSAAEQRGFLRRCSSRFRRALARFVDDSGRRRRRAIANGVASDEREARFLERIPLAELDGPGGGNGVSSDVRTCRPGATCRARNAGAESLEGTRGRREISLSAIAGGSRIRPSPIRT